MRKRDEGIHGYVPVSLTADSRYIILAWPPALSLQYTLHKATADGHSKMHHDQQQCIHTCVCVCVCVCPLQQISPINMLKYVYIHTHQPSTMSRRHYQ